MDGENLIIIKRQQRRVWVELNGKEIPMNEAEKLLTGAESDSRYVAPLFYGYCGKLAIIYTKFGQRQHVFFENSFDIETDPLDQIGKKIQARVKQVREAFEEQFVVGVVESESVS